MKPIESVVIFSIKVDEFLDQIDDGFGLGFDGGRVVEDIGFDLVVFSQILFDLFPHIRVPIIFNGIIRPTWNLCRDFRPVVANLFMVQE